MRVAPTRLTTNTVNHINGAAITTITAVIISESAVTNGVVDVGIVIDDIYKNTQPMILSAEL